MTSLRCPSDLHDHRIKGGGWFQSDWHLFKSNIFWPFIENYQKEGVENNQEKLGTAISTTHCFCGENVNNMKNKCMY